MKRIVKWAAYGAGGLLAAAALAVGVAFAASEIVLRTPQPRPPVHVAAAADPGAAERGRRLATVHGCVDCHAANLQGRLFDDLPGIARLYAPNLTRVVARDSDADLDRAIRYGVGADGHALYIMPSSTFAHLTDAETADLLAYLRTLKPAGPEQPRLQVGPIGRLGVLLGKFRSEPALIAARRNPPLADLGPQYAQGRSVARACVECHGPQLKGDGPAKAPDLAIAAAYEPSDFATLLRTGQAAGGRELGLMSASARIRFADLSDAEIAALHAYLKARAARALAAGETKPLPKP